MEFDSKGRRIPKTNQVSLLLPKKRGPGRPRKETIGTSSITSGESKEVFQSFEKRHRGRPRKLKAETNTKPTSGLKNTSETKIKLKLLETILGVYKEINSVEKENQKNIKKFYTLVESLD